MQKILYVITKSNWGGAQRYVYDLAKHFSSEYEVVVAFGENEFGGENIFQKKLESINVRTILLPTLTRDFSIIRDFKSLFALVRLFKSEKPMIVHLNSSKIGLFGGIASRFVHAKVVYTVHGLPFMEERPTYQNLLIKIATWITFALVDKVILLSDFEKSLVSKWAFVKNKIVRIYNGIDTPNFLSRADARNELKDKFGVDIDESAFVAGSIAELTPNKGIVEFLPQLVEIKNKQEKLAKKFVYIHFGTGELAEKLEETAKKLNLQNSVYWLGLVPDASRFLKALDLFTLPSKKEGLPYTMLEAKMAGVEILASDVGGIPEVLQNAVSEFDIKNMLAKTEELYKSL